MRVIATAAALAGLLVAAASPASAETTTHRYVAGLPASGPVMLFPVSGGYLPLPNLGGVWLPVPDGADTLDVAVTDDTGRTVAVDLVFIIDSFAPPIQGPQICGQANNVPVPDGTLGLDIRVLDIESLSCADGGPPVAGSITVTFSG